MQNNQYPKTVTTATDYLSNHRLDNRGIQNKKKWSNNKEETIPPKTKREPATTETSFTQGGKDKSCYCCGQKGHMSPECPNKDSIKKEDWAIKKATQYYMDHAMDNANQQANKSDNSQRDQTDTEGYSK